ncbi:gluconate 2-dehydrogenase subunit 3 family protein [Emticicia sp. SJ17W-69]|uniref:gluconate 2-dehydrogenase subunit 3 family protein n=1 Tax=Emticicia sp. SJ17W-69 TaxID=3421657 RepID=UPI003EBD89D8
MNRRDAVQRVAFLMGGALSAPTMIAMLEGCKSNTATEAATSFGFSTDYKSLVSEIAEIIIPKTSTPGAKDAGVGPFIEMMLKDCYSAAQQEHVIKGLDALEEASKKANGGKKFLESTPAQQTALLKSFEAMSNEEAKKNEEAKIVDAETGLTKDTKGKKEAPPTPFFKIIKELTLLGYFTSEVGATQSLAYLAVPGKYEGCVKMTPGQKAWALS